MTQGAAKRAAAAAALFVVVSVLGAPLHVQQLQRSRGNTLLIVRRQLMAGRTQALVRLIRRRHPQRPDECLGYSSHFGLLQPARSPIALQLHAPRDVALTRRICRTNRAVVPA